MCRDLNQGIAMFNAFSSNIVLFEDKLSFQWLGKRKKVLFGIQETPNGNTISLEDLRLTPFSLAIGKRS